MAVSQPPRRSNTPHRQKRGFTSTVWGHTTFVQLGIWYSQRRAHASADFSALESPSKGVPHVVFSQRPRRANEPLRRYRGITSTVWDHTTEAKLWIRHSQRRAPRTADFPAHKPIDGGAPSWRIHRHGGVRTGLTVDTAAFQTLCEPKRAVSSSRSGVLSVGGAHGRFYRPREPHRRGCRMWRFHSHRGVPTRPTVDTAAFHTLRGPNRAVSSSGSGILTVGRAYVRLYRPPEPH